MLPLLEPSPNFFFIRALAIFEERAAVADKIEGQIVAVIENVNFLFSGQGLHHSSAKAQSETMYVGKTVACGLPNSRITTQTTTTPPFKKQSQAKLGRLPTAKRPRSKKKRRGIEETKRTSTLQQHKAGNHSEHLAQAQTRFSLSLLSKVFLTLKITC
jgi:hypothetical protein